MRLRSRKDRSTAFSSPTASVPSRRSSAFRASSAAFVLISLIGLSAIAGACATGAIDTRSESRRPAARGEGGPSPLSRAVLSVSSPKVSDGSLLALTLTFSPEDDPGDAALLSGSFGETDFPFFPIGAGGVSRGYGALVGVPLGYPPGENTLYVHLLSDPGGRPEYSREQAFEVMPGRYRREVLRVDPKKVDPPKHELARIEREREEVRALYRDSVRANHLLAGFRLPVKSEITSPYGSQRIYNGKLESTHNGLDLRAGVGRRIYSSAPGKVVLAKDLYYTGNTVIVDHGYGVFTLYAHLSEISVRKGQPVAKGGLLGNAGATGRVNGPHLHWSAIVHEVKVNPIELTKVVW